MTQQKPKKSYLLPGNPHNQQRPTGICDKCRMPWPLTTQRVPRCSEAASESGGRFLEVQQAPQALPKTCRTCRGESCTASLLSAPAPAGWEPSQRPAVTHLQWGPGAGAWELPQWSQKAPELSPAELECYFKNRACLVKSVFKAPVPAYCLAQAFALSAQAVKKSKNQLRMIKTTTRVLNPKC